MSCLSRIKEGPGSPPSGQGSDVPRVRGYVLHLLKTIGEVHVLVRVQEFVLCRRRGRGWAALTAQRDDAALTHGAEAFRRGVHLVRPLVHRLVHLVQLLSPRALGKHSVPSENTEQEMCSCKFFLWSVRELKNVHETSFLETSPSKIYLPVFGF